MFTPQPLGSKTIFHIDYDSFFASVEQQANPFLRGKPVIVTGYDIQRGIAAAASIQAKKLGIKTGMPYFKAIEICPTLISVPGDFTKYNHIHKKSLEIFSRYTDLIEVFSIDEAFLDLTKTAELFGGAGEVARKIKQDIAQEIGEVVTCSIGSAPNKLLAKIASELKKPNGFFEITKTNLFEVIDSVKLTDFCGLGPRTEEHLNESGIFSLKNIRETSYDTLEKMFGPARATYLKQVSWGMGEIEVAKLEDKPQVKSISHQHTLEKRTTSMRVIRSNLRRLCEMVAERTRKKGLAGRTIFMGLRIHKGGYIFERTTLRKPVNTGGEMFKEIEKMLKKVRLYGEIRLVGMGITNLTEERNIQLDLFEDRKKKEKILHAYDDINNRFGSLTIFPAELLKADTKKTGAFEH
ncbi:MAG: DNA polymerase IV [Patescibacteria group bacterium]|jgi:DNA polymerase-4